MKLKVISVGILFILVTTFLSGCSSEPEPEGTWDDVVSDYNPDTNQFPNFNKTVTIEDTLKSLEYIDKYQSTKIYLRSNEEIPLYIDKASETDDNDLTKEYFAGDDIIFTIYIAEDDKYGEYVKEMQP